MFTTFGYRFESCFCFQPKSGEALTSLVIPTLTPLQLKWLGTALSYLKLQRLLLIGYGSAFLSMEGMLGKGVNSPVRFKNVAHKEINIFQLEV